MAKRILLGGVVGGVVLFLWGSVSHMLLPLGEVGIKELPSEGPVLAALRDNIREPGLYFFPGMGRTPGMTKEQQQSATKQWEQKYRTGPNGILIFHPQGQHPLSPAQLLTEFGSNVVLAIVAAFLLAQTAAGAVGFWTRVLFVALLGLVVGLEVDLSYWNWYGFPTNYTLAAIADHVVGYFLAGLALARLVPGR